MCSGADSEQSTNGVLRARDQCAAVQTAEQSKNGVLRARDQCAAAQTPEQSTNGVLRARDQCAAVQTLNNADLRVLVEYSLSARDEIICEGAAVAQNREEIGFRCYTAKGAS